jgi:hypothetical protein
MARRKRSLFKRVWNNPGLRSVSLDAVIGKYRKQKTEGIAPHAQENIQMLATDFVTDWRILLRQAEQAGYVDHSTMWKLIKCCPRFGFYIPAPGKSCRNCGVCPWCKDASLRGMLKTWVTTYKDKTLLEPISAIYQTIRLEGRNGVNEEPWDEAEEAAATLNLAARRFRDNNPYDHLTLRHLRPCRAEDGVLYWAYTLAVAVAGRYFINIPDGMKMVHPDSKQMARMIPSLLAWPACVLDPDFPFLWDYFNYPRPKAFRFVSGSHKG